MIIRVRNLIAATMLCALFACSSDGHRAPVVERGSADKVPLAGHSNSDRNDGITSTYIVEKGDTLFSIAFNNGYDYHELAELNNIENPSIISVGQEIKLPARAEFRPTDQSVASESLAAEAKPSGSMALDQPRVAVLPYSPQAMLEVQKIQGNAPTQAKPEAKPAIKTEAKPAAKPVVKPVAQSAKLAKASGVNWGMPTKGKLVGKFSESSNIKGVDIAGKRGQKIVASANGKVVYSGSGLRGYGKLVIIKHNSTYLSAYAHNSKILVKEGQSVKKGEKIAEMGDSDADQVKLHFEIRRFGKPVDPQKFLVIN